MSKKGKLKSKIAAFTASAVMAATSVGGAIPSAVAADSDLGLDNYAKLLQYSLYFYDANYCGVGAGEKSHISWRDDCHTDGTANGGFHDAGDGIICGLTEGFTASTLGWLYYEYKDEFQKTGTYAHLKDITNEFAQFFKNCTTLDGNGNVTKFIYEVGDDGADHGKWRAPELMSRNSSEYYSTTDGASNVAAQYAAALAQNYINFGNEDDLKYAKALYDFAAKNRKMTYEQSTYSDKSVEDDIAWAAGWLYLATNEQSYLDANSKDTSNTNDWINDYYYGGVWLGAAIINAEITGNWDKPLNYIRSKTGNSNEFYYADSWGSARYNTLMQMCAMIVTKHSDESGADFSEWCKGQMDMILGKNNANVCLVVGYNDVSATSPHHRAASGLTVSDDWHEWNNWDGNYANVPTSHTLYGALCGGPTSHTDFSTFRKLDAKDATSNEVALDYQVGLVGAAVGLYSAYGTGSVVDFIGDDVTVYDEEIAASKGEVTPPDTTTTTTETTTTTTTTTETTTTQTTTSSVATTISTTTTVVGGDQKVQKFVEFIRDIGDNTVTFESGTFTVAKDEDMEKIKAIGVGKPVSIEFLSYKDTTIMEIYSINVMGMGGEEPDYGDVDESGDVNINDAVLIMQSIANPDKYKLTEKGRDNADVVNRGDGVTSSDALAIQLVESRTITPDDLPLTSEELDELTKD